MKAGIVATIALLGAPDAWATVGYQCTIERAVTASQQQTNQGYIGRQFTVERQTGLIGGALEISYFAKPRVIDHGSTKNSFKMVATMRIEQGTGAGSMIYALTINEHEEAARKNFIFLQNGEAFLGWCEHI